MLGTDAGTTHDALDRGQQILAGTVRRVDRFLLHASVGQSQRHRLQALARLDRERLPYISLLTDPTTGGVTASYAMLGDLNIAEPGALIGFAGPRVIEQTIRQKLPEGFQRAEFLLERGMLDLVVDRREQKAVVARALRFLQA